MHEQNAPAVKPRGLQVWLLAARPKTLPAASAPVIVGIALALHDGQFQLGPALAAFMAALLLQVGANLANDVFDYYKGADSVERLGPVRVTTAGYLQPQAVMAGMWVVFGLAVLLGIYLTIVAGWPVIAIGLLSILSAISYTGGPFPLGYYGLGDLFVFLFFGLAAVCGTYYVQAGSVSALAWWAAVPMGLLTVAILVVNNLRDIKTDRAAGKRTLAVRLGVQGTRLEYAFCLAGAYLAPLLMVIAGLAGIWLLLVWLSAPLAYQLLRFVYRTDGEPLNRALARTGQLELLYSLLFAIGLVILT